MKKILIMFFFLLLASANLYAFNLINLWRHSEIADKNSLFADVGSPIYFSDQKFSFLPLYIRFDYMLPTPVPISAGLFFHTPDPNFKSFGFRLGYHINLRNPRIDVYGVYSFNCGFLLKGTLEKHNDTPPTIHYFDFRVGARYFFGSWLGFSIESGHKMESIIISLSIKIF